MRYEPAECRSLRRIGTVQPARDRRRVNLKGSSQCLLPTVLDTAEEVAQVLPQNIGAFCGEVRVPEFLYLAKSESFGNRR